MIIRRRSLTPLAGAKIIPSAGFTANIAATTTNLTVTPLPHTMGPGLILARLVNPARALVAMGGRFTGVPKKAIPAIFTDGDWTSSAPETTEWTGSR